MDTLNNDYPQFQLDNRSVINTSLKAQIYIFLGLTFSISWIEEYFIIKSAEGVGNQLSVLALMFTPGLVGIFCSFIFGHQFRDIGFKLGKFRYYLIAYTLPILAAILVFCGLIVLGIDHFEISPTIIEKQGGLIGALFAIFVVAPTLGALISFVYAFGEEVGWRGFLQQRFIDQKLKYPFLVVGLIWALWHLPLVLFSNYASSEVPIFSAALFTVAVTSSSIFIGWLRTASGSIFPAALAHGAHNLWIQDIYPAFLKKGPLDSYWGGESGILLAIIYCAFAVYVARVSK